MRVWTSPPGTARRETTPPRSSAAGWFDGVPSRHARTFSAPHAPISSARCPEGAPRGVAGPTRNLDANDEVAVELKNHPDGVDRIIKSRIYSLRRP